jgi:hypothetical protein
MFVRRVGDELEVGDSKLNANGRAVSRLLGTALRFCGTRSGGGSGGKAERSLEVEKAERHRPALPSGVT